jgi:hypothetical protein
MEIKKVVEIIVGGMLFNGNCLASVVPTVADPVEDSIESRKEVDSQWKANSPSNPPMPSFKKVSKGGRRLDAIREKLGGLEVKINELESRLEQMESGLQKGPDVEGFKGFDSVNEAKAYMQRSEIDEEELEILIEKTCDYYFNVDRKFFEDVPELGSSEEWRKAKVLEMLWVIQQESIQRPLVNIPGICYEKMKLVCENDEVAKAKLLLMSQCRVWGEEDSVYQLLPPKDEQMVKDSITSLLKMAQKNRRERGVTRQRGQTDF